jgi:hypothetical protein
MWQQAYFIIDVLWIDGYQAEWKVDGTSCNCSLLTLNYGNIGINSDEGTFIQEKIYEKKPQGC